MKELKQSQHVIALIFLCVGLILIIVGQSDIEYWKIDFGRMLSNVGAFVAMVTVISWLHDNYTRSKMQSDLFETISGSKSLYESGMAEFFVDSKDINFKEIIKDSKDIQIMFSYNSRFLVDYENEIVELAKRGGTIYCTFLSQQSKTINLMKELGWDKSSMVANYNKIVRAIDIVNSARIDSINICFVEAMPKYGAVKADNLLFIIFNTSSNKRQAVPAIRIRPRTPLWDFFSADLERLRTEHLYNGK